MPAKPPDRVAIDDVLPDLLAPGDRPGTAGALRALPAVRKCGVALDQAVNRAGDEARRQGSVSPADSPAHAGEFAEAEYQARVLDLGAAACRAMIRATRAQFPAPPQPEAEPPKKKG
jgi:hypothetical protein